MDLQITKDSGVSRMQTRQTCPKKIRNYLQLKSWAYQLSNFFLQATRYSPPEELANFHAKALTILITDFFMIV